MQSVDAHDLAMARRGRWTIEVGPELVVYLASPYTHREPMVMERRYAAALEAAAALTRAGWIVYSPIVHSHPMRQFGLGGTWDDWSRVDLAMLARCDVLGVLTIDGWMESVGVAAEVQAAEERGIPEMCLGSDPARVVEYIETPMPRHIALKGQTLRGEESEKSEKSEKGPF